MRPVVVAAVLLLVVLMSMSASAEWNPGHMCRTKFPLTPCRLGAKDWYHMGPNRCVKAFSNYWEKTQSEARKTCKRYLGDLVAIHSLDDLCHVECAMYKVSTTRAPHWIGLIKEGNGFVWTDRSRHDYSHWATGEPSNYGGQEHCVEMNSGGWGLWNDVKCEKQIKYVCQTLLE